LVWGVGWKCGEKKSRKKDKGVVVLLEKGVEMELRERGGKTKVERGGTTIKEKRGRTSAGEKKTSLSVQKCMF